MPLNKIRRLIDLVAFCWSIGLAGQSSSMFNGLSIVAPRIDVGSQPYVALKEIQADAVAIIPFGFIRSGSDEVRYNLDTWQWWGETLEGSRRSIQYAQEAGLQVMLKPQVYVPGSWPGAVDFTETGWSNFEASYKAFILDFAWIAAKEQVPVLCIGTELDQSAIKRPDFWRDLINEIRCFYSGELTYAANWDTYDQVSFWGDLDYIGIDAYFPLLDNPQANVKDLVQAWVPYQKQIEKLHSYYQKPVMFTEFGYLSVANCAFENWNLEPQRRSIQADEAAQARAFEALFTVFSPVEWWAGGFIWKWYIDEGTQERRPETDYTPQAKQAFYTIQKWYQTN